MTINIFSTAVLAFIIQLLFPFWWTGMIAAALASAVLSKGYGNAFMSGFAGIAVLWMLLSLLSYMGNEGILAARISALFGLGASLGWLMMIITGIIGGIAGGFGAMTGYGFRSISGR